MNLPLRCRCGLLRGYLAPSRLAVRAMCYCNDCQAYARFLGTRGIVDEDGGTEVVASLPMYLHFSAGREAIACMSLSERGILRWFSSCCSTPVANTPRSLDVPYVGVIHTCVEGNSRAIESCLGGRRIAVNTKSARNPVRSTPVASTAAVLGLMARALGARLSGTYRDNPFFEAGTRHPIRPVRVLSEAERERAYDRGA